jgi:UDP-N-acetylmuramoylalanine--D-glutamate ligase
MIVARGFEGKEVAIFGLARSGLAAARALVAGGARPVCWDENPKARAEAGMAQLNLEDLKFADWSRFAALVLAPGVPLTHPEPHWTVLKAKAANVPVMGDIELFARAVSAAPPLTRPKVVAITGTNGKSTTTALVGHMLRAAGRDARIGGNIGVPVLSLEGMHGGAVYVLELSSYQLDLTHSLKADVAVILNISPDHLDRHGTMENYVAAKRRILSGQGPGDTAVIGVDDAYGAQICTDITAANHRTIRPISAGRVMSRGVYALQGVLYDASEGRAERIADLAEAKSLPGRHNAQNAAAAYAAARALGLSAEQAAAGLLSFPGLAHRMETVALAGGIRVVNDSKATNCDAARQALSSYPECFWIAGGRAKEGGIAPLEDLFARVRTAYLIGEAAEDFAATLNGKAPVKMCGTLEAAAAQALADARKAGGGVVLFSPACASFDQFTDFEARGEAFRNAVRALLEEA